MRRARLIALTQVKNEERFLPGMLRSIEPHVDGIIALDDGSTDGTYEILATTAKVLEILKNPPGHPWDEYTNQVSLVLAARRHGADWLLCLDADERIERRFGATVPILLEQAEREGIAAWAFSFRELWGNPFQYRVDGIWGQKTKWVLFRNDHTHTRWDPRMHHRYWMPMEIVEALSEVGRHSGLNIYHLSMLTEEDRLTRMQNWEERDPERRWQPMGYSYMVDETGLVLAAVEPQRGFDL